MMEIDLTTLEAIFGRAYVRSDIPALENIRLSLRMNVVGDELRMTIYNESNWNDIATIYIPVEKKTTLTF